jgi:hypothetical protein
LQAINIYGLQTVYHQEKGNDLLIKSQCGDTVNQSKKSLENTRAEYKQLVSSRKSEVDILTERLVAKDQEINTPEMSNNDLRLKLHNLRDNLLSLKCQPLQDTCIPELSNYTKHQGNLNNTQPTVLLLGTSNVK